MASVSLNNDEKRLREKVSADLDILLQYYLKDGGLTAEKFYQTEHRMGENAHALHLSLKGRGVEPKHHAYMEANRGMASDAPEFYMHVHPVEDLLKFIDDTAANNDPVDVTLGDKFTFKVFSKRWGHDDTYVLERTITGWDISFSADGGPCDKRGKPFLYRLLDHDSIDYPHRLPDRLEWLWMRASEDGLSHDVLQNAVQQLADWVSLTEKNGPSGSVWTGGF